MKTSAPIVRVVASALLAAASHCVFADVMIPTTPIKRAASVVDVWKESTSVILGECVEAGDAKKPDKIVVRWVALGDLKEGQEIKIPAVEQAKPAMPSEYKPLQAALAKGSKYILFLTGNAGGLSRVVRSPNIGYADTFPDGTIILAHGACLIPGNKEESEVWQTLAKLRNLKAGTPGESAAAVRVLVRSDWVNGEICSPATLKAIEGLSGAEGPVIPGLLEALLKEDLPLLGRRDPGIDALAKLNKVKPGDPWNWNVNAARDFEDATRALAVMIGKGEEKERAAARRVIEVAKTYGTLKYGGLQLQRMHSDILKQELRQALDASTKDRIDWPVFLRIVNCLSADDCVASDVPTMVRIVRSPEFGGSFGDVAMAALGHLQNLTGKDMARDIERRDPGAEGQAWGKWWDETGSKDERFKAAGGK